VSARASHAAAQVATTGGRDPDLIVVNAKVYTMDAQAARAEAFAVTDGRFTAVGTTADVKGLASKHTETFDARGMTVVPGFIDCHNHAGGEVLLNEVLVGNPFDVEFVTLHLRHGDPGSSRHVRSARKVPGEITVFDRPATREGWRFRPLRPWPS
jgi:formylmethanofuran dehydrogenase subunit A